MPLVSDAVGFIRGFWFNTSKAQRAVIVGLTVAVIGTFFALILWLNQPDYEVLYSQLYPEDANTVISMLDAEGIPYKFANNGDTILVPAENVHQLRLKIAGEGNLSGDGIGFEIFDEVQIGQTDFVQRINYQRALQGELARTIAEFPQIERARVHLVIPNKSLFLEEQADPTASIVLKMASDKKLKPDQVDSIVNLVSLAVENLDKGAITVADTKGEILYSPKEDGVAGLSSNQLDRKLSLEDNLELRIERMLSPLYGIGRVIAKVNAEMDFSQKKAFIEEYDPSSAVIRSEQRSEETQQGQANLNGVNEPNFRGDGPGGALSTQDSARETRTTNYEINKVEREVISPVGELDRLSIAVIVDGTYVETPIAGQENLEEGETPETEMVFTPRTEAEIAQITQLVANAVGYSEARGDTIEVTSISFGGPEIEIEPNVMEIILTYMQRLGKPFLNGLLIFLFLILIVRPVVMALIRPKTEVEGLEELAGLPEGESRIALEADDEEEELDALRKLDDIRAQALQMSEQNMDGAMAIIKSWLKEEATV